MSDRPRRRDRRPLAERPAARPMAPVDKFSRPRKAGEFEDRVLACLRAAGPTTTDELAATLGASKRHVALALGTLRMARQVELDCVAGVNYWSAL